MPELSRTLLLPAMRAAGALNLPLMLANPFATHRMPLHAPDFPLVLLYTGKAGSTSLIKWFLFQIGKLDEALELHPRVHRYRKSVLLRQPGYRWRATRLIISRQKPIFKLVRNPYNRAVSSFLATLSHTREHESNPWGRSPIAAARKLAGKPASPIPALSFRDFVRFLAKNGTERWNMNGHVARQHVPGEDGRIDRIIRLERFAAEMRQIEREYRLAESPDELISQPHHQRAQAEAAASYSSCAADLELTSPDVRQGRFPPYDVFYDDETRRLVRQCFAADFEAYGYDV